jgi:alanyl-tRNA synthetase
MKKYTTSQVRQAFLDYFKRHGHSIVSSSSLIPANDPTLLFTNAGMVQFKDDFLGKQQRKDTKVVTIQRCMRAGGKHNDLENVGYSTRHHTFFEMLGNFSFGDYFKREAIHYAWEFLTKKLGIDPQKLWITVHEKDTETEKLWQEEFKKTKTNPQGLSHLGDKDNFWEMGDTGPCGYNSEIFYDHGEKLQGNPPGNGPEGERYVEIWNLVFMQFKRDTTGNLTPLPKPSVDTGMGLERIAAVMQKEYDNYEIDIFAEVYGEFSRFLSSKFGISDKALKSKEAKIASRVIADHIRAAVFLIAEGIVPSNERAGYVLRSIIRRASYYLYHLGVQKPCFFQFLYPLLRTSGNFYPELQLDKKKQSIASTIEQEEIQFLDTLDRGSKILNQEIKKIKNKTIPGSLIFTLHDTYGFPSILTSEIARQRGLTVDQSGFEAAMEKQRENSRNANKFSSAGAIKITMDGTTKFVGYAHNNCSCKIQGLFKNTGEQIEQLKNGEEGIIVLDKTPFYAESGGQVGDTGDIYSDDGVFTVQDTQKYGELYLHHGIVAKGKLELKNAVTAEINENRRQAIKLNHSATHLLHNGLRFVLGDQAMQRGSLVDDKKLRFDFTTSEALTSEELREIEQIVNNQIRANLKTQTQIKSLEDAKQENIIALFGEKYGDEVRVVEIGDLSKELCGGTHVDATGEIGLFKIVDETSIAAGIRRIEAVTGENALAWMHEIETQLKNAAKLLGVGTTKTSERLQQILDDKTKQDKELSRLQGEKLIDKSKSLIDQAISIGKIKLIATTIPNVDSKALRLTVDTLKQQLKSAVVALATVTKDNKIQLVVGVTQDLTKEVKANELLQHITKQIDGSGGGRPDMAQGGGTKPEALQKALDSVVPWIKSKMTP